MARWLIAVWLVLVIAVSAGPRQASHAEGGRGDAGVAVQAALDESEPLRAAEVRCASAMRQLVDSLSARESDVDIAAALRLFAIGKLSGADSALGRQIIERLDTDSSLIKHCLYAAGLRRGSRPVRSKHFEFYYRNNGVPDSAAMQTWDMHFERLARMFGSSVSERVPFEVDPAEPYGRSFPPWEVRWGIRQAALDDNPHELVHLFLFAYSDVPFFHEPLAMMYGSDRGDSAAITQRLKRYEAMIADSGYVSASEILHFPQLVGLDDKAWTSSVYFVHELIDRYGMDRLLALMRVTPWSSPDSEFPHLFREAYGIGLDDFERDILREVNTRGG